MGLLDGLPTEADYAHVAEAINPAIQAFFDQAGERARSFGDLLAEGLSPADILGLKARHVDALVAHGLTLLRAGESEKAKEFLTMVSLLDPMESRATYALGVIARQEGAIAVAARLFVQFLALDATNPDGHLRLGECLLANGELDGAEECIDRARVLAAGGHGDREQIAYAERLLGTIRDRR